MNTTDSLSVAIKKQFDASKLILAENLKSGKPTEIATLQDPETKQKIRLSIEVNPFKNRRVAFLFGELLDENGGTTKSSSLAGYKPKIEIIEDQLLSGLAPYTFCGLVELINY